MSEVLTPQRVRSISGLKLNLDARTRKRTVAFHADLNAVGELQQCMRASVSDDSWFLARVMVRRMHVVDLGNSSRLLPFIPKSLLFPTGEGPKQNQIEKVFKSNILLQSLRY